MKRRSNLLERLFRVYVNNSFLLLPQNDNFAAADALCGNFVFSNFKRLFAVDCGEGGWAKGDIDTDASIHALLCAADVC